MSTERSAIDLIPQSTPSNPAHVQLVVYAAMGRHLLWGTQWQSLIEVPVIIGAFLSTATNGHSDRTRDVDLSGPFDCHGAMVDRLARGRNFRSTQQPF